MLLAAAGSLALLAGAFVFQWLGYAPCKLCIWQRWPHGAAIAAGALVLAIGPLALLGVVGFLGALATGAIGIYHTGIERGFWQGPTDCTGAGDSLSGLSGNDLLSLDAPVDIVMCDQVAWAFLGISMASWNAIFSFGFAALWLIALRKKNRANAAI
ncbi:MAG: disulfide bond formation protein B [Silicimonas sp.]